MTPSHPSQEPRAKSQELLLSAAQDGDQSAMESLLTRHNGLIGHIMTHFKRTLVDRDDLIQEARLGFLMAVQRYDPRRGVKFSTVACQYIRNRIIIALRQQSHLIRLPWRVWADRRRLWAESDLLYVQLGRDPTPEELAEATGFTLARVQRALGAAVASHSLDCHETLLPQDRIDWLSDDQDSTVDAVLLLLDHEALARAITKMGEPYIQVITHRFCLGRAPFRTWAQLARQMSASRAQVHAWHTEAMAYLKGHLE